MTEDEPIQESQPPRKLKHFSHYIFEFVMMFLAVTMGFFVENQREKMSDQAQELQLMSILSEDLKSDIVRIEEIIRLRKDRVIKNDSLIILLNSPQRNQQMQRIYNYALSANSHGTLFYESSSMQFLSKEGFYKITSPEVTTEIRKYFVSTQNVLSSQEGSLTLTTQLAPLIRQLLDAKTRIPNQDTDAASWRLFTENPALINEVSNTLMHINGNRRAQIRFFEALRDQANKLMESIAKEYPIEK